MVKLFVGNIPSDCARADVVEVFEKYGKVKDCDIIRNFAFIHMEDDDDAREAAKGLNRSRFMGCEITVEESTSRPRNTQKLYVGNVSSSASRRELEKMFEKYGEVVSCDIIKDFAFVHMSKEREAEKAIKEINGIEYGGRKINVEFARNNNNRDRSNNRFGGNDRPYRDNYDRSYQPDNYSRGRGMGRGGYRGGGGGGSGGGGYHNNYRQQNYNGGGRYNSSYNRNRSPPRRRVTRSRSVSRSRSRSHSPQTRNDQRSRSRSHTPDRRSRSSKSD